jgi:Relaxase/Mobilisation nuclease domain
VEHLDKYNAYVLKDRNVEMAHSGPEGMEDVMPDAIRAEHERLPNKRVEHEAYTIYMSWHPDESDRTQLEKYNRMGRELAERWAPGHLAWVTTHSDKEHIHNHITICSIHSETGKALQRKRADFKRLHEINNDIARENRLRLNLPRVQDPDARLPDKVRKMVAKGKTAWFYDMICKIDYARAATTSFDEFVDTLDGLGVHARVEPKNITYSYFERGNKTRGKKLGKQYDKEGLMKAFEENDAKFAKYPGLRAQFMADLRAAFDGKGNPVGTPSNLLLESRVHKIDGAKDYGKFTKQRRNGPTRAPGAVDNGASGPYGEEMRKALKLNLLDYCAANKIALTTDKQGRMVLRGREFVVVAENGFRNTRNGSQGTIVDFVRIHRETTPIGALAHLTNNPRLLLLEPYIGNYKKQFQSFYVPKPRAATPPEARKAMRAFARSRGMAETEAETLLKSDRLHVGHDGSIWLFGDKNESAQEFREEPDGKWRGKRQGKPSGAFFESIGRGKDLVVHRDPFEFILRHGNGAVSPLGGASHLVLFDAESSQRLDELLAVNRHITEVHLAAHSARAEEQEEDKRLQRDLAAKFNPFDIRVHEFSPARARERARGPDLGL